MIASSACCGHLERDDGISAQGPSERFSARIFPGSFPRNFANVPTRSTPQLLTWLGDIRANSLPPSASSAVNEHMNHPMISWKIRSWVYRGYFQSYIGRGMGEIYG